MVIILQLINGLVLGCMYAAVASGMTLIWGTMKILNFSHGEFYMIGGYVLYFGVTYLGLHPIFAILLSVASVYIAGILVEKIVIRPLLAKPEWEISTLVATVGISIFFQNIALKLFGERYKNVPYFLEGTFDILNIRIAYQRMFILIITTGVILGFWALLKKTKFGFGLRATAQDMDAATLVGINTKKIYTITFGLSCGLAAMAAALLGPIFSINPWMGNAALLKGFIAVVLGGLGSFGGAIIAGILLGIVESISVIIFSSEWKDIVAFCIFILVLIIKPSGLFGTKEW